MAKGWGMCNHGIGAVHFTKSKEPGSGEYYIYNFKPSKSDILLSFDARVVTLYVKEGERVTMHQEVAAVTNVHTEAAITINSPITGVRLNVSRSIVARKLVLSFGLTRTCTLFCMYV
jgi:hypothetical protein